MITFKNVSKSYGQQSVLSNVTFEFPSQGIVCICGPSGIGKTTIFHLLAGLIQPDAGEIRITEDISMVFQEDRLIPWLSVKDNIKFVLDTHGKEEIVTKILNDLELSGVEAKKPKELSGGMQRRVAIARALAYNKRILLMDEPFKGLEKDLKHKIMDQVKEASRSKLFIIITHAIDEVHYLEATEYHIS